MKFYVVICSSSIGFFIRTTEYMVSPAEVHKQALGVQEKVLWPQTNASFTVEQHLQ